MPFACIPVRVIALLFAVLLPIKAVAATFVLVTGMPGHAHNATQTAAQQHVHCLMLAQYSGEHQQSTDQNNGSYSGAPLHDHPCPHLGMASIPPSFNLIDTKPAPHRAPALNTPHFTSITLDVPSPPPTRIFV